MKTLIATLALVGILLTTISQQTSASAKDTWVSVRSNNFLLVGNASEKEVKKVAARLEQFREVFTHLFPKMKFTTPVPTTVVVFKSDSSFRPFKPGPNIAGYFQPGPDVNYIALTTELQGEQDPFTVIFHEYTHLLVNNTIGNAPVWFNEGLAEYYSTFSISDDQKIVLGNPIGKHVLLLRQNKLLPLTALFQVDHKSPYYNERNKQSIFYAESWALMHYLIIGKAGRVEQWENSSSSLTRTFPWRRRFSNHFKQASMLWRRSCENTSGRTAITSCVDILNGSWRQTPQYRPRLYRRLKRRHISATSCCTATVRTAKPICKRP